MRKGQKRPVASQAKPHANYSDEVARLKAAIEAQVLAVRHQFGASPLVVFT